VSLETVNFRCPEQRAKQKKQALVAGINKKENQ